MREQLAVPSAANNSGRASQQSKRPTNPQMQDKACDLTNCMQLYVGLQFLHQLLWTCGKEI